MHLDLFEYTNDNSKNTILVGVDKATKWIWAQAINSKLAYHVADKIKNMIIPFGIPKLFVCDSGKEFKNRELISMVEQLNSNIHFTTVGRHQSNGQVERANRTLKDWMPKGIVDKNEDLCKCVLTYNNIVNDVTKFTPMELVFQHTISNNFKIFNIAYENTLNAYRMRYNNEIKRFRLKEKLKVGEIVLRINEKSNKMQPNWIDEDCVVVKGPYDGNHYNVKIINSKKKKIIRVHRDQIKKSIVIDSNDNPNLIEYLQSMDWLDRRDLDNCISTTKGKNWISNAKFAFKNYQVLDDNWRNWDLTKIEKLLVNNMQMINTLKRIKKMIMTKTLL